MLSQRVRRLSWSSLEDYIIGAVVNLSQYGGLSCETDNRFPGSAMRDSLDRKKPGTEFDE